MDTAINGYARLGNQASVGPVPSRMTTTELTVQQLFTPVEAHGLTLPHRVVMAPMTRSRATPGTLAPNARNACYYAQRAGAALQISEATAISPEARGYSLTPGIWTDAQAAGWRAVTDAVHDAGGRFLIQLWHVGRMSHSSLHDGRPPVAPSAVRADASVWLVDEDGVGRTVPTSPPRALELHEIARIAGDYAAAARRAVDAGADGVELHGGNGYLIDQFLRRTANQRTDAYGGDRANRVRFLLDVVDAVAAEVGAERVGVRLAPHITERGMADDDIVPTILLAARELADRGIGHLHIAEADWDDAPVIPEAFREDLRAAFTGPIIVAGNYSAARAERVLAAGHADLVAFGRAFVANPDLPHRLRHGLPLAEPRPGLFFGGGAEGYTDYPAAGQVHDVLQVREPAEGGEATKPAMRDRPIGRTGLSVPPLALGTGTFGGRGDLFAHWGSTDVDEARRLIDICLDAGANLFDSADVYSDGAAEEILGEALKGRRDRALISTKVGLPTSDRPGDAGVSAGRLRASVDSALSRLQTDRIDLLQVHGHDAATPAEELLGTLGELVAAGKVLHVGVSNYPAWRLMQLLDLAESEGLPRVVAHQAYYSLVGRDYEWDLMPLAADQHVGAIVWSPLGWGRLTGKVRRGQPLPDGRLPGTESAAPAVDTARLYDVVDVLDEIAGETGWSVPQLAIGWLLHRPTVASVLIGARTEAQLVENLRATEVCLDADQMARLDAASATEASYPASVYRRLPAFTQLDPPLR